jgi:outer membrane protein OmpA-like peptidoglycan-associated protein
MLWTGTVAFASAQSTLSLDDFDLGGDTAAKPKAVEPAGEKPGELEKCLLEPALCQSKEFATKSTISIDDVVNLGIIDREEVKATPVATDDPSNPVTAQALPSIDMEILFDYDSSNVRPDQYPKLAELANLLKTDKFKGYRFAFIGHSDAKGSYDYNRNLSRKRAEEVSQFVSRVATLPTSRMIATGLGPSQLKDPGDPFGAGNRRVQLVLIPVN